MVNICYSDFKVTNLKNLKNTINIFMPIKSNTQIKIIDDFLEKYKLLIIGQRSDKIRT